MVTKDFLNYPYMNEARAKTLQEFQSRFDELVEPLATECGCWIWIGNVNTLYGSFKMIKPQLLSYELFNGPIPAGLLIRHTCDLPCCVKPEHLILGTDKDNANDRWRRKRVKPHKLSETIKYLLAEQYTKGKNINQLILQFGTSRIQIFRILGELNVEVREEHRLEIPIITRIP